MVRRGPICLLVAKPEGRAPLSLWLPHPWSGGDLELRLDETRLATSVVPAGEGERISLSLPLASGRLRVLKRGSEVWSLRVAPRPAEPAWMIVAGRLAVSRRQEDQRQAVAAFTSHLAAAEPQLRARILSYLARLPGGEPEEARIERALEARRSAGQIVGEAYEAEKLARLRWQRFDYAGAERVVESVVLPPKAPAEARFLVEYEQGVVAHQAGDARGALQRLRQASARAWQLGLIDQRATAEHELALILLDLGRFEEAEGALARLEVDMEGANPCQHQDWAANRGWARLLAREAGGDAGDPLPFLRTALEEAERGRCPDPGTRFNAFLNLSLAGLQRQDFASAAQSLAAARLLAAAASASAFAAGDRLWLGELEARLALAQERWRDAERRYGALGMEAGVGRSGELLWRSFLGQAMALAASGDSNRALPLLRQAEDLVDGQSLSVPWPGRARFVAQREVAARLRIDLLLRQGRVEEAFAAARRARARVPRQLSFETRIEGLAGSARSAYLEAITRYRAERASCEGTQDRGSPRSPARQAEERRAQEERCRKAEEDLERTISGLTGNAQPADPESVERFRPPEPGEVILAFHPIPSGWVAFAADAQGVAAHRFQLPSILPADDALSTLLLAPFAGRLRVARRVRILAYGVLNAVDFHVLPFDERPLVSRRPVVYGLDLDLPVGAVARSGRSEAEPADRRALIVSDPRGDLRYARDEAEAAGGALEEAGWSVRRLDRDDASSAATRAALGASDLFHYAGHARPGSSEEGGELSLAAGERLTASEILTLERVPALVVLTGCDSAVGDRAAPAEGLGLAQAFLLRGARQVIAAERPVGDSVTAGLFAALYRFKGELDLARLLRSLQVRAYSGTGTGAERVAARSFRVYEP